VARLQRTEEHRRLLVQQRVDVGAGFSLPVIDWRVLERQAREKLTSWRTLAMHYVSGGRQLLQALLKSLSSFDSGESGRTVAARSERTCSRNSLGSNSPANAINPKASSAYLPGG
jgi:hypothetical protein